MAALRRVRASLKRHRAAVLKAACEGLPTEAEWSRTADHAEDGDTKTRRSASSAKSAVTTSTCEPGFAPLSRILTERRQNWQGRGQYKEPTAPLPAHVPPFSNGWAVVSLDQRTSSTRPICCGILMLREIVATGVLFVKAKDMKRVNIGDVWPTPVPLSSLAEQTRIVAEVERRLSVVEELASMETTNLQRATHLRQSVLQNAFTGGLLSA